MSFEVTLLKVRLQCLEKIFELNLKAFFFFNLSITTSLPSHAARGMDPHYN